MIHVYRLLRAKLVVLFQVEQVWTDPRSFVHDAPSANSG